MFPFVINLRIVMSINQLVCIPSSQTWLPKNMRELKQYLFKLKWVVIKCYYVMASQIWQAQKDNAINKSYRRMHFMYIQKKPFSKAWFYHSIQSWIVQIFLFLLSWNAHNYNAYVYVFCGLLTNIIILADYLNPVITNR